jgi:putative addiction module killer protein
MQNPGERELRLYVKSDGGVPFTEWFDKLRDDTTKHRIDARLARLRLGNAGDCEPVGGGVYELRLHFGPGYRIYFGQHAAKLVILLCGGDKSTQQRDIQTAKMYWADYKQKKI